MRSVKLAVVAVAWHFLNLGLLVGNWVARLKDILDINHLSYTVLGSVLVFAAVGALVTLPIVANLQDKFGSAKCLFFGNLLLAGLMPLLGISGVGLALLYPCFFCVGIGLGFSDMSMTAQGVAIEKKSHQNQMGFFQAILWIGNFVGVMFGGAMAFIGLTPLISFALMTAISIPITCSFYHCLTDHKTEIQLHENNKLVDSKKMLESVDVDTDINSDKYECNAEKCNILSSENDDDSTSQAMPISSKKMLLYLCLTGFCAQIGQGTIADWATIYFRDDLNTSPLVGSVGFACFSLAMAGGSLYSDKLGETHSRSRLLRIGGGLGAGGLGLTVLAPSLSSGSGSITLAVIGLTLSGFGLSMGMPVVLSAAGDVPDIKSADSIAMVTGVTYLGFLVGPPFFGLMADILGAIRWALLLCSCIIFIMVVLPGSPPPNKRCQGGEEAEQESNEIDDVNDSKEGSLSPLHRGHCVDNSKGYTKV